MVAKEVPNPEGIGGKSGKIVMDQFDPQQKTAERLADEYGVSAPTVKRAGQFAEDELLAETPSREQDRASLLLSPEERTASELLGAYATRTPARRCRRPRRK